MPRSESEQRARILDAAIEVFAQKGPKGATIRLVGRAAGVNSGLLYYYFEDKHTLFVEALEFVLEEFLGRFTGGPAAFRGARERIGCLVDGVLGYFSRHPDRMQLLMQAFVLQPDLLGGLFTQFLRGRRLAPLEILADGMARGDLRRVNPLQAWWSIIGMCLFSLRVRDVARSVDPAVIPVPLPTAEERRTQIVDLLVQGLAADVPSKRTRRS